MIRKTQLGTNPTKWSPHGLPVSRRSWACQPGRTPWASFGWPSPPSSSPIPARSWPCCGVRQTEADRFLHRVIRVHASEPKHGYPGVWKSPPLFRIRLVRWITLLKNPLQDAPGDGLSPAAWSSVGDQASKTKPHPDLRQRMGPSGGSTSSRSTLGCWSGQPRGSAWIDQVSGQLDGVCRLLGAGHLIARYRYPLRRLTLWISNDAEPQVHLFVARRRGPGPARTAFPMANVCWLIGKGAASSHRPISKARSKRVCGRAYFVIRHPEPIIHELQHIAGHVMQAERVRRLAAHGVCPIVGVRGVPSDLA